MSIENTLSERGIRYGSFKEQAEFIQHIKSQMGSHPNWYELSDSQRESLEMIISKISRIINGDPNYVDSWHDIAGYAILIEQELKEKDANTAEEEKPEVCRFDDKYVKTHPISY